MTKSKSHESQLAAAKNDNGENNTTGSYNRDHVTNKEAGIVERRARLPTEPNLVDGYNSPLISSPIKSPPYNSTAADSDDSSYKCKFKYFFEGNTAKQTSTKMLD